MCLFNPFPGHIRRFFVLFITVNRLSKQFRRTGHIQNVIIGVSNRAEIWNAERWAALEAEELNPENLAAVMEELGF